MDLATGNAAEMVVTFCGRPLDELSREELIKAVEFMYWQHQDSVQAQRDMIAIFTAAPPEPK